MEISPPSNFNRPESGDAPPGGERPVARDSTIALSSQGPVKKSGAKKKYARIFASYLVAGVCLFWVFHDIHPDQFLAGMVHIQWWPWSLCIVLQFLAYLCVAYEWQWLLRPTGQLPLKRAAQAVFAGRFANDALPLQLGYLVRATLAARWMRTSVISVFPSLIVERLWDGIWLMTGIIVVTFLLPLPSTVVRAAIFLGAIVFAGVVATMLVVWRRNKTADQEVQTKSGGKLIRRIRLALERLAAGVRDIVHSGLLAPVLGLSLLKLAIQAAAFLGFLWAYNLHLSIPAAMAVFLVGYLGICVPSTPAGTGMFQLFVVAGLTLFGIGKSVAAGFALVTFVAITVPLAVAGFFALAQSGLRLRQIQNEASQSQASG